MGKIRRNKRDPYSIQILYEPEIIQTVYFYLNRIVSEFDISLFINEDFLKLFEINSLLKITTDFFKPIQDKINLEVNSEELDVPVFRNRRRSIYNDVQFYTLEKCNFTLNDLESDIVTFCDFDVDGNKKIQDFFENITSQMIEGFDLCQSTVYKKIEKTFEILGLPQKYLSVIHFLHILEELQPLSDWIKNRRDEGLFKIILLKISGISRSEYLNLTNDSSKFISFGLLKESGRLHRNDNLEITSAFHQFLMDDSLSSFGMRLVKEDKSESQPLDSFFLNEKDKSYIKSLLDGKNSAKVLLYGTPGSGKTEFAKSLSKSLDLSLLKIDIYDAEDRSERKAALVVGELATRESKGILLMDESDDLLNEGKEIESFFSRSRKIPEKKIWMNEFLDSMQGKVIFISNEFHSIHPSVLRRFDYSLEFFPADQKQREYYWNRVLDLEGVKENFTKEKIKEISEMYPTGVGGITSSIRSAKKIITKSESSFVSIIQDVLSKQVRLIGEKISKPILSQTPYDPSLLHTDSDLDGLEQIVSDYLQKLYESGNSNLGSLCLLFYGKPGTGKTEYARYLAKKFELDLVQKRGSDLRSMWVGETEKNIARGFHEVENKKGIFFLDEADSFFRSRELAKNSWEGSATNEFLTWMESFSGIFIASTNFMKDFDPAALRRFAWKGEFKPLKRDDKIKILLQYFPELATLFSYLDMENIKEIPGLTPGDFRAIWNRMRFRDMNSLSSNEIINALRSEASFKSENQNKEIGF
jgi:transitional endoplasmic reticulum ATPase